MPLPAIDVIIPAIEKDLGTLPRVIDSVRSMVQHPIGTIMIVSPDTPKMRQLCARKRCVFVNENTVLPITKKHIRYRSAKWDRSGWLYQQLLKLSGDKLSSRDYYLTIDADTVLLRPHRFTTDGGRTIFYYRNWSQPEYFVTYRKLMGRKKAAPRSFVTHYMLFKRSRVARLKRTIEDRHQTSWYKAILRSMNRKKQFAFSEFETYGNYYHSYDPHGYLLKPARNVALGLKMSQLTPEKRRKLALSYRSVSLHKRKWYTRQHR